MSPKQVLITRPEPEASALAENVVAIGLAPIVCPGIEFEPRPAGIGFDGYWKKDCRRLAVFCSPRAVSFGLRQLPAGFLEDVELAAIGPTTADALEVSGLSADILAGPPYNSESLLKDRSVTSQPGQVLLFTSPGGRQALRQGLQSLGWDVAFAHVYDAVLQDPGPAVEAQARNGTSIVSVWTSSRVLQHMAKTMDPEAWAQICRGTFLVTSGRLAEMAESLFGVATRVAPGPANEDIFRALADMTEQ